MTHIRSTPFLAFSVALSFFMVACGPTPPPMNLQSDDFMNGGMLPAASTCDGTNQRPMLRISNVPSNAVSLAIILDDPDAPNGTFTHWIAWNIDPATNEITPTDTLATAMEGTNGAGTFGYYGPCPPTGTHHYNFKLFALSKKLDALSRLAKVEDLTSAMAGSIIVEADLQGLYARPVSAQSSTSASSSSSSSAAAQVTEPGSTVVPDSNY